MNYMQIDHERMSPNRSPNRPRKQFQLNLWHNQKQEQLSQLQSDYEMEFNKELSKCITPSFCLVQMIYAAGFISLATNSNPLQKCYVTDNKVMAAGQEGG